MEIEEEQRIKQSVESSLLKMLKKEILDIVGIADSIDVAIACDDDLFRADRLILSAWSSFLENILSRPDIAWIVGDAISCVCEIDKVSRFSVS